VPVIDLSAPAKSAVKPKTKPGTTTAKPGTTTAKPGTASTSNPPSSATPPIETSQPAKPAAETGTRKLTRADAIEHQMERISSRALRVVTLKNGAKLYTLPGGRQIEQVPGKSPYVVKAGNWADAKHHARAAAE
jgi:hypothetical protein